MSKKRKSAAEKSVLLSAYASSNEPLSAFCRRHEIASSTFSYWLKQSAASIPTQTTAPLLEEIVPPSPLDAGILTLHIGAGLRLDIPSDYSIPALARLIELLQTDSSC